MNRWLHVIAGPNKGQSFEVSDAFTTLVGRSKHVNAQLTDTAVSRVHCELEIRNKRILLSDLDSASGTFVNDKRIDECELNVGDVLRLGNTRMRVDKTNEAGEILEVVAATPARPVLMSADRLGELTGHRLSHYDIGPTLAQGQSGQVFRAYDFKNDRLAALKVLWPEFSQNDDDVQRFVRAMKTMGPLRHPNLVALYSAGKAGPYCWVAMELVEGESLAPVISRVAANKACDWKQAIQIAHALTKALVYAHGQHVIHRNLTPANVLIGKAPEQTKLGDLMLAKAQEGGLAQQITKPGEILGDLRYMSPERTADVKSVDARSDLYSLGALTYAMLTGRPPLEGSDLIDTMTKIRRAEPLWPRKDQPAIPKAVEEVTMKLLAKRPEDRYPTAAALRKEWERVAQVTKTDL
jgi:serine/threonine protein kinase